MLTGFHLFFTPTVWFACLLPADSCLQTLSWLFLIQTACSSAAALFYLRRTFLHCPDTLKLVLAVSYTFSDFLFTKFTDLRFLNISAFFPLFLYSLDLLLKRGKYWPYLLISTYMMAVAPYFFWMWGVFSIIYIGAQLKLGWALYKSRQIQLHLLLFAGMTLLALGLSAFSWIPSYLLTHESARAAEVHSLRVFFMPTREPLLLTCWMLTPLLFSAIVLSTKFFRLLYKSAYGLALVLLLVCCCCITMNWIMHMGPPVSFPVRFSYMLTMMSCCLVAQGMNERKKEACGTFNIKTGLIAMSALLIFMYAAKTGHAMKGLWAIAFATTAILWNGRHYKTILLVLSCLLCISFVKGFRMEALHRLEDEPDRLTQAEDLQRSLPPFQVSPWSRVRSVDFCLNSNFSEVSGLNSFCNFFHSSSAPQQTAVNRLGYVRHFTRICDEGGSVFSDAFMGCEFLVARHPLYEPLLERLPAHDSLYVYRNPYYWGDGVLLPQELCDRAEEWDDAPVANQQRLFEELGGEGVLFDKVKAKLEWENRKALYAVYQTEGKEWLYMDSQSFPVSMDCFKKSWYDNRCARGYVSRNKRGVLVSLPTSEEAARMRVLLLRMAKKSGGRPIGTEVDLYRLNVDKLAQLAQKHRGRVRVTSIHGRTMEVEVHPDEDNTVLLMPYVYHKGYSAKDETGKALQVFAHHGFTAIRLAGSGKRTVALHYALPYERASLLLSAGCLLLLPLPALMRRLHASGFTNRWKRNAEFLIGLGVVMGSLFVLSSPVWSKLIKLALNFR